MQGLAFEAARAAHHAGRQKIKFEDFQFAFRKDPRYLGKVQEVFEKKVEIESARKTFNQEDEDLVAAAFAAAAAANGTEMDVDTVAEGASGGGPRKSTAAGPATSGSAADPGLAVPMPLSRSGGADGSQQAVDDEELGEADDDAAAEEDALGSRVR